MENENLTLFVNNGERTRRRKFSPEKKRIKCEVCKELGNLESMLWQKIGLKDKDGEVLYGCFYEVYFCGERCKEMFKG